MSQGVGVVKTEGISIQFNESGDGLLDNQKGFQY